MVVFTLFLGRFAKLPSHGIPFPIFCSVALVPWSFVAAALPTAASSLIVNSALINKVYFPREIFPLVGVIVAAADTRSGIPGTSAWDRGPRWWRSQR